MNVEMLQDVARFKNHGSGKTSQKTSSSPPPTYPKSRNDLRVEDWR